jgi:hypothetical protein
MTTAITPAQLTAGITKTTATRFAHDARHHPVLPGPQVTSNGVDTVTVSEDKQTVAELMLHRDGSWLLVDLKHHENETQRHWNSPIRLTRRLLKSCCSWLHWSAQPSIERQRHQKPKFKAVLRSGDSVDRDTFEKLQQAAERYCG